MALAGGGSSKWVVFAAASIALVATTLIAILVGGALSRAVPEVWIRRGAGLLFIAVGVLFLLGPASVGSDSDQPPPEVEQPG
jgi:putative Ca2+/H+ antiporter (TMEM165/GDT1 family)